MLECYRETYDSIFEENFEYLETLLKTFKLDIDELEDQAESIRVKENILKNVLQNHTKHQKEYEEL